MMYFLALGKIGKKKNNQIKKGKIKLNSKKKM